MTATTGLSRVCTKCKQERPMAEFYKQAGCRDGRHPHCSTCQRAKAAAWHRDNTERHVATSRAWYAANRQQAAASRLMRYYGLTEDEVIAMRAAQFNACAICEREFTGTPYVDHCHTTGNVRGLLCNNCNRALGWFGDNPASLRSAILYLIKHIAS